MTDDEVLDTLAAAAAAVGAALGRLDDWGLTGEAPGQHHADVAADAAAVAVLVESGCGVVSEESSVQGLDREIVVVVDPLDGSTNASRGLPWYATSLCAVDEAGPRAALVVDLVTGVRYEAVRGRGARRDGVALEGPAALPELSEAIVGLSGWPPRPLGWGQFRAFGALALDLCAVADGRLDAYVDCSRDAHGVWDYLGGALICAESGVAVVDALDRDLVTLDPGARRTPVAAVSPELCEELVRARRTWD